MKKFKRVVALLVAFSMCFSVNMLGFVHAEDEGEVVLYENDFSDSDAVKDWSSAYGLDNNVGEWVLSTDKKEYQITGGRGNKTVMTGKEFDNFIYEADVTVNSQHVIGNDTANAQGGIIFRVGEGSLENGADGYKGYYFGVNAQTNQVVLGKARGNSAGSPWEEMSIRKMPIEYGETYSLRVEVNGNHIVCYVNYSPDDYAIFDLTDDENYGGHSYKKGNIGFRNWSANVSYSNVKVTAYDEEPVIEGPTYTNPLIEGCADPDVVFYEGTYYMYCTSTTNQTTFDAGIQVYTSTDLTNWTSKGLALDAKDVWGDYNFWAPDVFQKDGKFYMYYTAEEHLAVATSDSPLGPFLQEGEGGTMLPYRKGNSEYKNIDAHVYEDEDGTCYFYFVAFDGGNVLYAAEMNDDLLSIKEDTVVEIIRANESWETHMGAIAEGPYMLKKDGIYYLTYSGSHFQSPNYGAGYATSSSPMGPFVKYENNPIMKSNSAAKGTGHHGITYSPDGEEMFMAYHSHNSTTQTEPRQFCIDPMRFSETKVDKNGYPILEVNGPTVTPQALPSWAVDVDNFIEFVKDDLETVTSVAGSDPSTWGLPSKIRVTTSKSAPLGSYENGSSYMVDVTWDVEGSGYNKNNKNEQTFEVKGTVDALPEGVENLGNISLEPVITVNLKEIEAYYVKIEAEDATLVYPARTTQRSDASGGYKVGYIDNDTATVTFTLNAPAAGKYRVDIASGSGEDQWNTSHAYYVNGNTAEKKIVEYQNYGWDYWTLYPIEVELNEGENTLTITHSGQGSSFSELDYIVYYMARPDAETITVDGSPLQGFDPHEYLYEVDVDDLKALPQIDASIFDEDTFTVDILQPTENRPQALVTVKHRVDPECEAVYTINFVGPDNFSNPLVNYGADPYVTYEDGYYYYIRVYKDKAMYVSKSAELERIGKVEPKLVYTPAAGEPNQELWAPEIFFIDGRWYIYYTGGAGSNHRMQVLRSKTDDAQGEYEYMGEITPETNRWAIDQTVLEHEGKLYAIWSGWDGSVNEDQRTYIAEMSNPWTITGDRVELSRPEYEWEKRGSSSTLPTINEGAQIVKSPDGVVNIVYSAAGSWSPFYCLGILTLKEGGDPMVASDWIKGTEPIFEKNGSSTFSTGHASFTTSPDGKEGYVVYHATKNAGDGWNGRGVRTQRFYWNEDGTPYIGTAIEYSSRVNVPSGTIKIDRGLYEAEDAVLAGGANTVGTYNSSGGKKVTGLSNSGASATFTVNAAEDGQYKLYVGAASGTEGAGFRVSVNPGSSNEQTVDKGILALNASSGRDLATDNWFGYEIEVKLSAGDNTIVIQKSPDMVAADLDYIEIEYLESEKPPVDKSELEKLIESADALQESDYTADSWKLFQGQLNAAKAVAGNPEATEKDIEHAYNMLYLAMNILMPADGSVNKVILEIFLDAADEAVDSGEYDNAIQSVKDAFDAAYTKAKGVYEDPGATKAEVMEAALGLLEQLHCLGLRDSEEVDKTMLKEYYILCKLVNLDLYGDEAAVNEFKAAMAEAERVIDADDATQTEVNDAYDRLVNAFNNLELIGVGVDKTNLLAVINMAKTALENRDQYTDYGWDELNAALTHGQDIYDNSEDKDEIEAATERLAKAVAALRYKANKKVLKAKVAEAKAINVSLYTDETAAVFLRAFADAQAVLMDETLTKEEQEIVDAAVKALENAIKNLVEKITAPAQSDSESDSESDSDKPKDTTGQSNKNSGKDTGKAGNSGKGKAAKTGDANNTITYIILCAAALAMGTIFLVIRKKRVNK